MQRNALKYHESLQKMQKSIVIARGINFFRTNYLVCLHACSTLTHQKKGKNRIHAWKSKTLKARDQFFHVSNDVRREVFCPCNFIAL